MNSAPSEQRSPLELAGPEAAGASEEVWSNSRPTEGAVQRGPSERGAGTRHVADALQAGAGVGVAAIVDFATLAIVSQWLGPAAFGTYGVYLTLMTLVGGVSDLGLGVLLTKRFAVRVGLGMAHADDSQVALIFQMKAAIAALLVATGIILFVSGSSGPLLLDPTTLMIAFVGAAALSLSTWISAWFLGAHRFGANAVYSVATSGAKLTAVLILCVTGRLSPVSGLIAAVAANITAVCAGFALVPLPSIHRVERATVTELWDTARWVGAWSILSVVIPRADILLVRALGDPAQTGHYLAATKLCAVLALANTAANTVLLPKLLRLTRTADVRRSLRIWIGVVAGAAVVVLLPAELFARQLVQLVYGSAYEQSTVLFRIVVVGTFLEFSLNPFAYAALVIQRPAAMTLSHAARLAMLLLFGLILTQALGAIGMAVAVVGSATLALGGLAVFVLKRTTVASVQVSFLPNEYTFR